MNIFGYYMHLLWSLARRPDWCVRAGEIAHPRLCRCKCAETTGSRSCQRVPDIRSSVESCRARTVRSLGIQLFAPFFGFWLPFAVTQTAEGYQLGGKTHDSGLSSTLTSIASSKQRCRPSSLDLREPSSDSDNKHAHQASDY
jgi:hypothetical protein